MERIGSSYQTAPNGFGNQPAPNGFANQAPQGQQVQKRGRGRPKKSDQSTASKLTFCLAQH